MRRDGSSASRSPMRQLAGKDLPSRYRMFALPLRRGGQTASWSVDMTSLLPVVIVHRNQPERLRETVAAFRAQDVPVTIAVVDNASTELPKVDAPDAVVLDAGRNLGFGPGANLGFRHFLERDGAWDWIALAPHDALPQPGCLRRMLDALDERPRAGLACADV